MKDSGMLLHYGSQAFYNLDERSQVSTMNRRNIPVTVVHIGDLDNDGREGVFYWSFDP